jgi:hypothetical protein
MTGLPWCPDCVLSVPAIRRALEDRGAALLEVGVGQRADWKGNAAHPCRCGEGCLGAMARAQSRQAAVASGAAAVASRQPHGCQFTLPPSPLPRTDPRFKVTGVPTLVHWLGGGRAGAKLGPELEAAKSPQEAVALVGKFLLDTAGPRDAA